MLCLTTKMSDVYKSNVMTGQGTGTKALMRFQKVYMKPERPFAIAFFNQHRFHYNAVDKKCYYDPDLLKAFNYTAGV